MITISLCMIVKNEEDVLARCLDSVAGIADEIIIVDTGSNDTTKQIAQRYTSHIYDFTWIDDFAAARNFAFSKATQEYTLWLDADDVLEEKDREKFLTLKASLDPSTTVVMMRYHVGFHADGTPSFTYYRERLLRTDAQLQWVGAVHEVIVPCGNILYSDIAVTHRKLHVHDPQRNLRIFQKMVDSGTPLDARQQFYYARELYYHGKPQKALEQFEIFLAREDGWVENQIDACQLSAKCHYALGNDFAALQSLLPQLQL